jgi:hypothetical protein
MLSKGHIFRAFNAETPFPLLGKGWGWGYYTFFTQHPFNNPIKKIPSLPFQEGWNPFYFLNENANKFRSTTKG